MNNLQGGNVAYNAAADFAAFDPLPRPVKEMVWGAPYPLDAVAVASKFRAMGGERETCAFLEFNRVVLTNVRGRQLRERWPEGHPMLGEEVEFF